MNTIKRKKPWFAYRSFQKELEAKKNFAELGGKQFCVFPANTVNALGEPYSQYAPVWLWHDVYDFTPIDEQIEDITKFCPDAEFLVMIDLNTPPWLVRHMQCKQQMSADSFSHVSGTLANDFWREKTMRYMEALLEYTRKKYGSRILCYILACGATDEWMDYSLGDETEGKLNRYRNWCIEKAYPVPESIPTLAQRYASPHHNGELRDPIENRDAIRYWKFHSDLIASGICDFAAAARKHVLPEQEIGVFYGYILELAKNYQVGCGHLSYEEVFQSENIDFLIGPGEYGDRRMGGGGGFQNLTGSMRLHKKHYLHELDHHTHTCNLQLTEHVKASWVTSWPDVKSDIAGLRREFCRSLAHGTSVWWFDMWGGSYVDKETLDALRQMHELWDEFADYDTEPDAEVAIIADPDGVLYCNDHKEDNDVVHIFRYVQRICNRFGAPYALQDISDLPKLKKKPKLAILPFWVEVDTARRELLKLTLPDTRFIWVGPCGLSDGTRWLEQTLTGLSLPDYHDLTPEIIRKEAERAGVHLYTDPYLPVWATDRFLSCHAAESGTRTFHLKRPAARIIERFSNQVVAEDSAEFTYTFDGPESVMFELK